MENENVTVRASLLDNTESEDGSIQGMKCQLSTFVSFKYHNLDYLFIVTQYLLCYTLDLVETGLLFQWTAEKIDDIRENIHMKRQYLVSVSMSELQKLHFEKHIFSLTPIETSLMCPIESI